MTNANLENNFRKRWRGMPGFRTAGWDEIGQALVELALVFPIFILLLVGAAEFGRLAYAAIEVANAARAGAAYGSLSVANASQDGTNGNPAYIQQAAIQDAPNVAGMIATAAHSCVCSTGGAISCTTALSVCPSPARIIEYVQVNTTADVGPLFNYPGLPHKFTLTGQAIMRVEE